MSRIYDNTLSTMPSRNPNQMYETGLPSPRAPPRPEFAPAHVAAATAAGYATPPPIAYSVAKGYTSSAPVGYTTAGSPVTGAVSTLSFDNATPIMGTPAFKYIPEASAPVCTSPQQFVQTTTTTAEHYDPYTSFAFADDDGFEETNVCVEQRNPRTGNVTTTKVRSTSTPPARRMTFDEAELIKRQQQIESDAVYARKLAAMEARRAQRRASATPAVRTTTTQSYGPTRVETETRVYSATDAANQRFVKRDGQVRPYVQCKYCGQLNLYHKGAKGFYCQGCGQNNKFPKKHSKGAIALGAAAGVLLAPFLLFPLLFI